MEVTNSKFKYFLMGVATYKTAKDMSEELRRVLPDVNELRKLLENETIE